MKMRYLPLLLAVGLVAPPWTAAQDVSPAGREVRTASLSPRSPSSFTETFTIVYSDPAGIKGIEGIRLLANDSINGKNACYIYYVVQTGSFLLVNDSGEGSQPLKSDQPVRNARCTVYPDAQATLTNTTLKVRVRVALNPDHRVSANLYTYVDRSKGASQFTWQGVWAAPEPLPPPSTTQ